MTYEDMTNRQLVEDVKLHTGESASIALVCGIGELIKRFESYLGYYNASVGKMKDAWEHTKPEKDEIK